MTQLTEWNPFRELENFENRLASLFGRRGLLSDQSSNSRDVTWAPLVDIQETEHDYVIRAEVPGVDPKKLSLTAENGVLTLKGEREFKDERKENGYMRIERAYGAFARSFVIPSDADASKVKAHSKDGVLEVRLPKMETAKPKTIQIHVE